MKRAPTLMDAIDLLHKHPDAINVEVWIGDWQHTIMRETIQGRRGYRLVRAKEHTPQEVFVFASDAELLRYAIEVEGPAVPANQSNPRLTPEQRSLVVQAQREIERVYSGSLTLGTDLETAVQRVLAELVSRVLQEEREPVPVMPRRCDHCGAELPTEPSADGTLDCPNGCARYIYLKRRKLPF